MMQNFDLEDLSHVQSRRNLLKYLVRVEMASDWFTVDLSIDFGRTIGLGGKHGARVPGCGVPGYGVPGCGKRGVRWKTRGLVENVGSGGKRGVWWKTRSLSGKHGVPLFFAKI